MGHTKGEWSACCLKSKPHFVFAENGYVTICSMIQSQDMVNDLSDEEVRANAKLIAAAPDMLEALIEANKIIEKFTYLELGIGNKPMYPKTLELIDNAINKATK